MRAMSIVAAQDASDLSRDVDHWIARLTHPA
jgi:hypothetical protein